jgi:hypothetical protein
MQWFRGTVDSDSKKVKDLSFFDELFQSLPKELPKNGTEAKDSKDSKEAKEGIKKEVCDVQNTRRYNIIKALIKDCKISLLATKLCEDFDEENFIQEIFKFYLPKENSKKTEFALYLEDRYPKFTTINLLSHKEIICYLCKYVLFLLGNTFWRRKNCIQFLSLFKTMYRIFKSSDTKLQHECSLLLREYPEAVTHEKWKALYALLLSRKIAYEPFLTLHPSYRPCLQVLLQNTMSPVNEFEDEFSLSEFTREYQGFDQVISDFRDDTLNCCPLIIDLHSLRNNPQLLQILSLLPKHPTIEFSFTNMPFQFSQSFFPTHILHCNNGQIWQRSKSWNLALTQLWKTEKRKFTQLQEFNYFPVDIIAMIYDYLVLLCDSTVSKEHSDNNTIVIELGELI